MVRSNRYYMLIGSLPALPTHFEDAQRVPISKLGLDERMKVLDADAAEEFPHSRRVAFKLRESAHALATGMIDVEPLISHRLGLSQALEAFEIACNKAESGAIKVVLDCQK